jgi:uncharacterized delta-60 repeat protein
MFKKYLLRTFLILCFAFCAGPVLSQNLALDGAFAPTITGGAIKAMALQPDQKILIGGKFTTVNGTPAKRLARLNTDGTLDTGFVPDTLITNNTFVSSIQVLADGKILVAGDFGPVGSPTDFISRRVLRLNADGSLDSTLTSQPRVFLPSSEERDLARQSPNGKIWLCGNSNSTPELGPARLARFNNDGSVDTAFVPIGIGFGGGCEDLEIMPDGKTLIAALFNNSNGEPTVYGQPRPGGVARLNADDTLDTGFALATFGQNVGVTINDLQPRPNGNIYFGYSTNQAPSFPSAFARIDSSGANRTIISPWMGPGVFLSSGKSMFVGRFAGQQTNRFIRFFSNDIRDELINTVLTGDPVAVIQQVDGKVLLANTAGVLRYSEVPIPHPAPYDFDGDGKTDVSVFRPSDRYWYTHLSSNGSYAFTNWGLATDKLVAGDYDNDGKADVAVNRGTEWYILRSSDSVFEGRTLGDFGGMPFTSDLDNDGLLDIMIRERNGASVNWKVRFGNGNQTGYGPIEGENWTDTVIIGNFVGDLAPEYGYFRDGDWTVQNPIFNGLITHFHWGATGDIPVPGDYDGDSRTDPAVFRPSDGNWYILGSATGYYAIHWGLGTDEPVPGDYDGDGKTDLAVYRNGDWYMLNSTAGYTAEHWGAPGDLPVPSQFLNRAGTP